jgi:glycosyltransferase involved in cell wall biosynthesis
MRYLWDMYHEYFRDAGHVTRFFMKRLIPGLRVWDITSANLVDRFITNSHFTASRIARYYNREADVVFGPAEIEPFLGIDRKPEDFYLFFGQITGYKRADLAVAACENTGRRLALAGAGAPKKMRNAAKKTGRAEFLGRVGDEEKADLFSRAKALIFPGIEDLGLVPIEAAAAGLPVIAYRQGGALDTVKDGVTGLFFDEQTPQSLAAALERFESLEGAFADRAAFTAHAARFSKEAFKERVGKIIAERKRV